MPRPTPKRSLCAPTVARPKVGNVHLALINEDIAASDIIVPDSALVEIVDCCGEAAVEATEHAHVAISELLLAGQKFAKRQGSHR